MPSVAEILLQSGRSQAEAKRREGQIAAQKWSTIGDVIGNSLNSYLREKQEAPARERANRIGELQLGEAEAAVAAREAGQEQEQGFQQTMGSGKGRDAILKSLENNPELYKRASEHFERIDTGYKRLMGDVAAGVRSFGDDPEAALIAIDDLIAKGFDERQMDQYRKAIQENPQSVAELVDGLLGQSPDEAHRKMVRPKVEPKPLMQVDPTKDLANPMTGEVVRKGVPEEKPDTRSLQLQANDALKRGDTAEYQRIKQVIKDTSEAGRAPVIIREGGGNRALTPNAESQVISRLARNWTDATKPARELDRQVSIMREGIKAAEGGQLAQGGQAVLVTFQKILDPNSVVRESEFDRSREGLSLMDRARAAVERLSKGGAGVPLTELRKYAKLAEDIAKAQRDSRLSAIQERLGRTADRYNIPRELVFEGSESAPASPTGGRVRYDENGNVIKEGGG